MINHTIDTNTENIGIYLICNQLNGKRYVGQSKNLRYRITMHKSLLKHNKHHNTHMQRAYNSAFSASIAVERSDASMRDALNGRSASCAGYRWKYISITDYDSNYSHLPIITKSHIAK